MRDTLRARLDFRLNFHSGNISHRDVGFSTRGRLVCDYFAGFPFPFNFKTTHFEVSESNDFLINIYRLSLCICIFMQRYVNLLLPLLRYK